MSVETPTKQTENSPERSRKLGSLLFEVAQRLDKRDSQGYTHLFAPNAAMKLGRIAEYLQTDPNPDLDGSLIAVEHELKEFGRHMGRAISDDTSSLRELSGIFNDLSESLKNETSGNALEISRLFGGISDEIAKREMALRSYFGE